MTREAFARSTDPWTSWAAADSLTNLRQKQRAVLWAMLERYPDGASLDQIVAAYRLAATRPVGPPEQSDSGIRSRVSELQRLGYVLDTGRTRTLPSGRRGRILIGSLEPITLDDDGQLRLARGS
jgi:hypothetical protein